MTDKRVSRSLPSEFECFRPDQEAFANALSELGVDVERDMVDKAPHCVQGWRGGPWKEAAAASRRHLLRWLEAL